jgi:hypothetical protein
MQASLPAHTREWSGNPAALGCYALRPVALRPRLSNGFALVGALARSQDVSDLDRIPRSRCHKHGRLSIICLVVWHLQR